jgi:hypothetical protein
MIYIGFGDIVDVDSQNLVNDKLQKIDLSTPDYQLIPIPKSWKKSDVKYNYNISQGTYEKVPADTKSYATVNVLTKF